MASQLDRLDWQPAASSPGTAQAAPQASPLRDPARAVTVIGAVLMIIGCSMPWAVGIDGLGHAVGFGASGGQADGVLVIVAGLVIAVLTAHRGALDSRSRSVQVAPLALAAVAAMIWISGAQSSRAAINEWVLGGGSGSYGFGLWLTLMGIAIAARGSAWVDGRRSAEIRSETSSLRHEWAVTRHGLVEGAAATISGIAGAVAGLVVGGAVAGTMGGVLVMIFACVGGLVLGASIGGRLARLLLRRLSV